MGQSAGKIVRRSPSTCPGPNNLPQLQFHSVHGDNIRLSRDGTLARRFESFCRAITFSSRPICINERICIKFAEISNNWNGGIRFGFTSNDPVTLENALPKYACPDLTNRPGFWAKALSEQYCEKDSILYYYVNTAGDVIYGINNVEKGVVLSGIDTRGLLWTVIDIYGNCTAIEFVDTRIYMYQQNGINGSGASMNSIGMINTLPCPQMALNSHNPHQQSIRSLPATSVVGPMEHDLDHHILPSLQSLNIASTAELTAIANDLANRLPPLRYNPNSRLIPVPFHITKGRNIRLSHDRFIATRSGTDFCQGYVFTARPIRIGEKLIVQVLKTDQNYVGSFSLGLTSCNPAILQPTDLPNDSDFLLDRPEYWVVSKNIVGIPKFGDEIAFFVAPNGEVSISLNNGTAVVVMHVDQSLQLWAFLDIYGSTKSVRMFRQQLPNMNNQIVDARKMLHPAQLNVTQSTIGASSTTLGSLQTVAQINSNSNLDATTTAPTSRMISMPSNSGDILQIQPNGGGTVLVVNLPPATSSHDLNAAQQQARLNHNQATTTITTGVLAGACSSNTFATAAGSQHIESISNSTNLNLYNTKGGKDSVDQQKSESECTICYENQIDSVLYMCGHMCMCYDCAIEQWRGVGGGHCPLCRAVIRDVIRTYTT